MYVIVFVNSRHEIIYTSDNDRLMTSLDITKSADRIKLAYLDDAGKSVVL